MARLIDVDALIERLSEFLVRNYEPLYDFYDISQLKWPTEREQKKAAWMKVLKRVMDAEPTVDAEPVRHGRWIEIEDSWDDCHYQCTGCGEEWYLDDGTPAENNMNYCPHCGAKMDGCET